MSIEGAPDVRSLSELRRADEPRFGGKSAGLGEMLSAGMRVPPGFALAPSAFESGGGMGEAVRSEIARRYAELGPDQPPVAVRSSAIGEDSESATFAGQQETVLWVRGVDPICDAARRCWESLYSPTAVAYRAKLGGDRVPAMGVAIQLMVDAAVSGVLFTCNPVSGDPSMVAINASWGLGVAIVGGEVTPDDYLVSKITGEVVREQIGSKLLEYVPDPGGQGVLRHDVPADRACARCLDADGLAELVTIARAAERHCGSHQDVEWAQSRAGVMYVLQSRPVTATAHPEPAAPTSAISLVMAAFGAGRGKA